MALENWVTALQFYSYSVNLPQPKQLWRVCVCVCVCVTNVNQEVVNGLKLAYFDHDLGELINI